MRSSFFEFSVARSALFVARGGIDTTMHNVSNASTKGYSRQIIEQRATSPLSFFDGRGMVGTGSEIFGITQARNGYLDKKYWSESSVLGEYSSKSTHLAITQTTFNELTDTGLSTQFNDFFNDLENLTTNAGDFTYRANVLSLAESMTTLMKNTYNALKKQQSEINGEVKTTVTLINSLGQQISSINKQIRQYESDGSQANDLRDARALLVDELAKYVNIEVSEVEKNSDYAAGLYPNPEDRNKSDKEFSILINGSDFVKGGEVNTLVCKERKERDNSNQLVDLYYNPEDIPGLYDIYWKTSNTKFNIYHPNLTGELKGLVDLRDGNNENFIKNSSVASYNDTSGELVLNLPADSRFDLTGSGGSLSVFNPTTGRSTEYYYSDYTYNNDGTATFTIINPKPTDLFTVAGVQVSVGETSSYKGIPYYMSRLNDLVRTFATAMNEGKYMDGTDIDGVTGHLYGYDLEGNTGINLLYTYKDNGGNEVTAGSNYDVYKMTADNFIVNSSLLKDPKLLAASIGETIGESDNQVILSFLELKNNDSLFMEGGIKDFIVGMTTELGIDVKQANNFSTNYSSITTTIDNQRMSVSGVDINEEMINMLKYQQQYQAAAKLINVIDRIYDMTINQLGV